MNQAASVPDANDVSSLRDSLANVFQTMELQRRQAIKAFWTSLAISLVLLPVCFLPGLLFIPSGEAVVLFDLVQRASEYFQTTTEMQANVGMVIFIAAAVWFFGGLYLVARYFVHHGRRPGWNYLHDYKSKVFTRVCELHFGELAYTPNKGIPWRVLDDSHLFPWSSDWYSSNDYFDGQLGQTDISFAEATAKRERKRLSNDGYETYLDVYFRGIIFIADFHKHFHSTTRIIPTGEKVKRVWGQKEVILEDPDFERLFETKSTDQIDVRYILSTSMMLRLQKLHDRFPKLRVLFQAEKMIMLLPTSRDRFEPSLYKSANNMDQVNAFIRDVDTILPVVDELNLNLRIWSKY